MATPALCPSCKSFLVWLHIPHLSPNRSKDLKSIDQLIDSRSDCILCDFIILVELQELSDRQCSSGFSDWSGPLRELSIQAEVTENVEGSVSEVKLSCVCNTRWLNIVLEVWVALEGNECLILIIFKADLTDGQPNSSKITNECPITDEDSPEILSTIRKWLNTCFTLHQKCSSVAPLTIKCKSASSYNKKVAKPQLPTRVLDIGHHDTSLIKLVISQGEAADYVALSYCWGNNSNDVLKTTTANLNDHIHGFSVTVLPKTFRDAIKIAREAKIRFIWIDSLCIAQDDLEDWKQEAANMCAIYENAIFTIAAASANNPSVGCFTPRRHKRRSLSIPIHRILQSELPDAKQALINFSLALPKESADPKQGPLFKRAWAMQEWYLSRRIVFCSNGRLSWRCNSVAFTERGELLSYSAPTSWDGILTDYASRQLTYETDRLIALQGIATSFGKGRNDQYHYGIWRTRLPELLFWTTKTVNMNPRKRLDGIPSWSWASLPGEKEFWSTWTHLVESTFFTSHKDFKIDTDGTLRACLETHKARVNPFMLNYTPVAETSLKDDSFSPEQLLWSARRGQVHYLHDVESTGEIAIGVAAMDDDYEALRRGSFKNFEWHKFFAAVTCVPLIETPRYPTDKLYPFQDSKGTEICRHVGSISEGTSKKGGCDQDFSRMEYLVQLEQYMTHRRFDWNWNHKLSSLALGKGWRAVDEQRRHN